jgi:hypothetical protein
MSSESIPARWRSTRAEAAAIRECARSHSVSDRAVRQWRRANDPRWLKFLSARAGLQCGQLEAEALRTDLEHSTPEDEERAALRRFKLLETEISRALSRGELGSVPVITRAAGDAHKLLSMCRAATREWKVQRRELVPLEEITRLRERAIEPLVVCLKNMPAEVAAACNPTDPDHARAVLTDWLQNRLRKDFQAAQAAFAEAATPAPEEGE